MSSWAQTATRVRLWVPLGDARGRLRGEQRGQWRHVERRLYRGAGSVGLRTGEIVWRGFWYAVRERGPGRWSITLCPVPLAEAALVRIPPGPGQVRGQWRSLWLYRVRRRTGVRRGVLGYVAWRGRLHRVCRGRYGLELALRRPPGPGATVRGGGGRLYVQGSAPS